MEPAGIYATNLEFARPPPYARPVPYQERRHGDGPEDRRGGAEDAGAEVADQEDLGGDVVGVGVEVGDRWLVGEGAQTEQDPVERQRPQADPGCAACDGSGGHGDVLLRRRSAWPRTAQMEQNESATDGLRGAVETLMTG